MWLSNSHVRATKYHFTYEPSATDLEPDHKKVEKEPIHTLTFLELKQQK